MKRLFIAGCIVFCLMWFFAGRMGDRGALDFFTRLTTMKSAFAFSGGEIESRLKTLEAALPEVQPLIAGRQFPAARGWCDAKFYELRRGLKEGGDTKLGGTRTLAGELRRLETEIAKPLQREFQALVRDLERGGIDSSAVIRLVQSFPEIGGVSFQNEWGQRTPQLDPVRAALARNWIRLVIHSPDDACTRILEEQFKRKLNVAARFRVVHGPAVGPLEEKATFATFRVKAEPGYQSYGWVKNAQPKNAYFNGPSVGGLLNRIVLTVHRSRGDFTTSWDARFVEGANDTLGISLEVPAPERIELPRGRDARDELIARNGPQAELLQAKLTAALVALPPLRLSAN